MSRCLLIASSDTSGIDDCTEYPDENAAKAAMVEAYRTFIEFPPDFRERYFKGAHQALKRDVDKLSLTEFATDGGKAAFLSQLLDDETELVYFNSLYYTVDEFVRQVMSNTRYFIAKDNVLITD